MRSQSPPRLTQAQHMTLARFYNLRLVRHGDRLIKRRSGPPRFSAFNRRGTTMSILCRPLYRACVIFLLAVLPCSTANCEAVKDSLARLEVERGIVAVIGLPEGNA